jgi:two-component system, OmpR family, sensor histidine kinase KdpD
MAAPPAAPWTPTESGGRGKLRIYLGAAAGVGKTYRMLGEGNRRRARGTDVAVGFVETHGRPNTAAQIKDLPIIPRRKIAYHGGELEEMDLDSVLSRHPAVALVDELAHTNVPGSRNAKRWQDVRDLCEAGIEVISTVNIQHLASLTDVVQQITGVEQRETVPDGMVRSADQIELVDMTSEALRRRMAHGNIYPAAAIDSALANFFRPGNLSALRELALLWMADRVEEDLADYRVRHGIRQPWETKERVLVALSGEPDGEALIRRGARMAARGHGELHAVHVRVPDGTVQPEPAELDAQRRLLAEVDGTFTEITGADVPGALLNFAAAEDATQLLLAQSRHGSLHHLLHGSVVKEVIRRAGPIDVHLIFTGSQPSPVLPAPPPRYRPVPIPRRRSQFGWLLGVIGVGLLAAALSPMRTSLGLPGALLCLLLAVVGIAFLGGLRPAVASAIVAVLAADYFFVPPIDSLDVARPANVVALIAFLSVAGIISLIVDRLTRRTIQVARARAEAEALARLAGESVVAEARTLPDLVADLRRTFDLDGAAIMVPDGQRWRTLTEAGGNAPARPSDSQFFAELDQQAVLTLSGRTLSADDTRLLSAFVTQLRLAQERARLQSEAAAAAEVAESDKATTALLEAVSHDLRNPLTVIKAAVSSLIAPDGTRTESTTHGFYRTIDTEVDQVTSMIAKLLEMSRLHAGALPVRLRDTDVAEVLYRAVDSLSGAASAVAIDLPDLPPAVLADEVLLERAVANVMANAQAVSPAGLAVRVQAGLVGDRVEIRVIDQGSGVPEDKRQQIFEPFKAFGRRDDAGGHGLGLAIAKGFTEAMGGELSVEDTPGGGATFVFSLPRARPTRGKDSHDSGACRR